jgi:predicted transcriptional regulator
MELALAPPFSRWRGPAPVEMAGTKGAKGKSQVRIANDLVAWLDRYAAANQDGLTSRALVAEEAIRHFRDYKERQAERRAAFEAWVAAGRRGPPPFAPQE